MRGNVKYRQGIYEHMCEAGVRGCHCHPLLECRSPLGVSGPRALDPELRESKREPDPLPVPHPRPSGGVRAGEDPVGQQWGCCQTCCHSWGDHSLPPAMPGPVGKKELRSSLILGCRWGADFSWLSGAEPPPSIPILGQLLGSWLRGLGGSPWSIPVEGPGPLLLLALVEEGMGTPSSIELLGERCVPEVGQCSAQAVSHVAKWLCVSVLVCGSAC